MSRKYTAGGLVDVFDVRGELYDLRNTVQEWKNNHLSDPYFAPHDPKMCRICLDRDSELSGIDMAIRRFGGSPRR